VDTAQVYRDGDDERTTLDPKERQRLEAYGAQMRAAGKPD
jgi:hypothetical protein